MSGTVPKTRQVYPLQEVHRFIKECLLTLGTSEPNAEALANCLTEADYRGHYSDGLNRLETYINEISEGGCAKNAVPQIIKESPVTALVDGQNGLGVVVGNFCMNLAIKKAKTSGIGWVVARGSNRYGIAGYYSLQALSEGFLGMSFSNTSPLVAPTNATARALGTNPMSVAAPGLYEDNFVLDMATATAPAGKIEMLSRNDLPVPSNWADKQTGTLCPIGGQDFNLNYKGYGLGLMVEIFCGILSGSAYGPHIRKYGDIHRVSNFGQCFIAVNPSNFEPGFEERLSDLMNLLRNLDHEEPDRPVLIPGDRARTHMSQTDKEGGVHYVKDLVDSCDQFAKKLNVKPLRPLD